MECPAETLELLEELQAIDFRILNLKRTFDTLPQRQTILTTRQNLADVRERKESVMELVAKARAKVQAVKDEDARVAAKQDAVNALLKDKATGFREAEARTKELAGYAKRRETLAHNLTGLQADLDKVLAVEAKIDDVLSRLEAAEASEVASFKQQGGDLMAKITAAKAERAALVPKINEEMLALYEKTSARCGGVAIAHLKGDSCSVCRATIDEARLRQCRREAPVSVCPLCHRLLVIE